MAFCIYTVDSIDMIEEPDPEFEPSPLHAEDAMDDEKAASRALRSSFSEAAVAAARSAAVCPVTAPAFVSSYNLVFSSSACVTADVYTSEKRIRVFDEISCILAETRVLTSYILCDVIADGLTIAGHLAN